MKQNNVILLKIRCALGNAIKKVGLSSKTRKCAVTEAKGYPKLLRKIIKTKGKVIAR